MHKTGIRATLLLTLFILNSFLTPVHCITAGENITRFFSISNGMQRLKEKLLARLKPKDAHSHHVALVRHGKKLAPEEAVFVGERKTKARMFLEAELSKRYGDEYRSLSKQEVPTIGICFSGGGYRAMFATIGYLQGLDQIGVLNATTYISSLSGSSWALAPWILSNQQSADQFAEQFIPKVTVDDRDGEIKEALKKTFASNSTRDLLRFMKMMITKKLYGQSVSLVDYFGFTVSNPLLRGYHGKRFFQHKCSDLQQFVDQGAFPLPIFMCNEQPVDGATWFEFTPYEFGSHNYQAYIPIWSFGRTFKRGRSIDTDPEQSLSYILGICGSGFAYSFVSAVPEVIDHMASLFPYLLKLKKFTVIKELFAYLLELKRETAVGYHLSELEEYKFGTARIANPTYKMPLAAYSDEKTLQLSDGGQVIFSLEGHKVITHSFASVPLLQPQRAVDIIIMCDSDRNGVAGEHLRASVLYAEQQKDKLKQFPSIDYAAINQPVVRVFKDKKDQKKPIVLSVACIPDGSYHDGSYNPAHQEYTDTLNFAWLDYEAIRHSGLAQHIIAKRESEEIIWRTIKEWVDSKRPRKIVTKPPTSKQQKDKRRGIIGVARKTRSPTEVHWGNKPNRHFYYV